MTHRRLRRLMVVSVGVVLFATIAYLTVLALQGERLVRTHVSPSHLQIDVHDPRAWLIVALAAALAMLLGWFLTEHKLAGLERSSDALLEREQRARERQKHAERQLLEAEERLQESERERQQSEQEREREKQQYERAADAWRSEREWNKHLREQILQLQHQHGILGHFDIHDVVLQLIVELVEAEKGILLSRKQDDSNCMEVVSAIGFEHDPRESAIAQRFAQQVIAQDTTIRDDDEAHVDSYKRTPADEEVQNLLAIPIYLRDEFHGVIVCANRERGFEDLEDDVLLAVGDHAGAVLQNNRLHGELRNAYLATVRTLASVIEVKDPDLRRTLRCRLGVRAGRRRPARVRSAAARRARCSGRCCTTSARSASPSGSCSSQDRLTDEERERHAAAPADRLSPRSPDPGARADRARDPAPPRALRRERLSGPAARRGDPDRGAHHRCRRRVQRDDHRAAVPDAPRSVPGRLCGARALRRRASSIPQVVRLFVEEVRRRPPDQLAPEPVPPDPELELHREPGGSCSAGSSFGITDSLTLLYSHRHFHETAHAQAQRALVQNRPFALVIARLTELDTINHESGFAAGDAALQTVAHLFRVAAGRVNGTAFRVSGRRIALLAPDLDVGAATRLAESLREELRDGPAARIAGVSWRAGESGEQTIERALRTMDVITTPAHSGH